MDNMHHINKKNKNKKKINRNTTNPQFLTKKHNKPTINTQKIKPETQQNNNNNTKL